MANRPASLHPEILTIRDLKEAASKKLPKMYREYFNEGAMDLITLHDNEEAYNRYKIRPRILVNVADIDTSTTIFGKKVAFPFGFSPAAMHKLAHPDGEVATSRAAAKNGICMGLSAYATTPLEEVAAEGLGNPYAMQVSVLKDRNTTIKLIRRAEKAGFSAIFLTVDAPVLGRRLNEFRNSFTLPDHLGFPNLIDEPVSALEGGNDGMNYAGPSARSAPAGPTKKNFRHYAHAGRDSSLEWETVIPWLRSQTKMQIWVKGIYTADDVVLAIRYGLDGVIISNHGGRQLDGVPATLDALRECAPAAAGKIPVAIDGGIRRGSDVFKALALGACHCFAGRVPIWGLAYDGEAGVDLAINTILNEFRVTMGLAGCKSVKEITRGHLSLLGADGVLSKL